MVDGCDRPRRLGTTFSPLQCYYLGIDYQQAFSAICSLGWDVIRLCGYWFEIEPVADRYNFTVLDWLLEESQRYPVDIVLTVGMKAPRWPEYHFPDWVKQAAKTDQTSRPLDHDRTIADRTLNFTTTLLQHARQRPNLKYWQVENEPAIRQPITSGRWLSPEFVRQETDLVRSLSLPGQKILLTTAIGMPFALSPADDRAFRQSLEQADAVGINVYTKIGLGLGLYLQPSPLYWYRLQTWQQAMAQQGREAWIAEAQAEPWERKKLVAIDRSNYPSASPHRTQKLVSKLAHMGYETVMLWGCEYWYWQWLRGHQAWWNGVRNLLRGEPVNRRLP
ncbi:hypothetical protein BST81_17620 [Leptolyngbya sp. 'hensonii']|uniref:beta-galactosidase n=1 Tax=Leptolyngbya sp. 'hensonii' TaxID=1922337 RepID=UPI00094FDDEB|nr:beta-galactosidase [Leptolyngbya sp. 'hensonii']OLP17169.1 hypothetical protein BST81_17620 [Leptolyngbya sp. 'hensonii']